MDTFRAALDIVDHHTGEVVVRVGQEMDDELLAHVKSLCADTGEEISDLVIIEEE